MNRKVIGVMAAMALMLVGMASAQKVSFKDPTGDDNGPGNYTYPTDGVYKRGSFDMTAFDVEAKGGKVDFDVTLNSPLEDPWRMGGGFSTQMIFIFIDNKEGGFAETFPGLNVNFAAGDEWDRVVIISPQPAGRVKTEVQEKLGAEMAKAAIIPTRTKGAGRTLSATVDQAALGEGDPSQWGYQVLVQSNEGFPEGKDLLTRKVNEYEGQHRFGGGTDYDCDPGVMDLLAADAQTQHDMLKYECNPDGSAKQMATLKMITKQ